MLKFLLASSAIVTVLILSQPARSAVIADLGVNPTSAQGEFSNSAGGGAFEDQFTFQLVGGPQFVAIGSATNVFASPPDFITSFTGQLSLIRSACPAAAMDSSGRRAVCSNWMSTPPTNRQLVAGIALLDPGNYYLEFAGIGGGTSGYGGNLSTFAVPGPLAGGIPAILAFGSLLGWRRWRRS